jgi:hypothetical protein
MITRFVYLGIGYVIFTTHESYSLLANNSSRHALVTALTLE